MSKFKKRKTSALSMQLHKMFQVRRVVLVDENTAQDIAKADTMRLIQRDMDNLLIGNGKLSSIAAAPDVDPAL